MSAYWFSHKIARGGGSTSTSEAITEWWFTGTAVIIYSKRGKNSLMTQSNIGQSAGNERIHEYEESWWKLMRLQMLEIETEYLLC
jgi:hypothetical protein